MPRSPRLEQEGGIHHVTMRGNRKQTIFADDRDRSFFLNEFEITAKQYQWTWLAYCLMSNHCHLVIETPTATLGLGMRRLNSRYAQAFNDRHRLPGHLFQERYGSVLVDSDVYLCQLLRYVALNPVTAGLVSDPQDWRWSSHRLMLAGHPKAGRARVRVDSLLEAWGGADGKRYARLFDANGALAKALDAPGPWSPPPSLDELLGQGSRNEGIRAAREHGYLLAEIAAEFGVHHSTVSRWLRR
jgi:putative transposase